MSTPSKPSPFARELIEKEIDHLKKRKSVRDTHETRSRTGALVCVALFFLFALWALDPVLFSYNRGDAARVYLYMHNYGDDRKAHAVADSGLLTVGEVNMLNRRQGNFQDYFNGTEAAQKKAASLIHYMDGVHALHQSRYDELSPLNKIRYILFIKTGLTPPIEWTPINSSIEK